MKVRLSIDGVDFSRAALIDGLTITQDSTQGISTLTARCIIARGGAQFNVAHWNQAVYSWSIHEWQEIRIWDADTSQVLFGGFILKCDRSLDNQHLIYNLQASDYGIFLERCLITQTWPDGTLDSTIVTDALVGTPIQPGNIITQVTNMGEIDVKDARVRDLLESVCGLSGGEWHVDYMARLNYYRVGSVVAPFALSDEPDGITSVGYMVDSYTSDFADAANKVTVLGSVESGDEVTATAEDTVSQSRYGVLSAVVVARDVLDETNAALLAGVQVAERAWPKPTVTASLFVPGLARGMTVDVESQKLDLNAALVLRSLKIEIAAPDRARAVQAGHLAKYTTVLGWRPPDLVYTLRRMQRRPSEPTTPTAAPVPDGSIDTDSLAEGLSVIQSVAGLPPLPDDKYGPDAVIFNTLDRQLYRRTGNTWTAYVDAAAIEGQIQTEQLAPGSVTSVVLADGSVVSAKIPTGAIKAPQIDVGAVTVDAIGPGAVTGPAIASEAITAGKIAANAVTAETIAANAVTANAIAANAVTTVALAAGSVTANAIAAQAVTATALQAGSVTANAIAANSIAAEAIQANAVTAQAIAANAVTAGKIAALAVLAGNIAADAVTAGTIAAAAINTRELAAGAVVADRIAAGQIGTAHLDANEIQVGYGAARCGQFTVWNIAGRVGVMGDLAAIPGSSLPTNTYFGVWAKIGGFGGTGYEDATVYTDTNGNLFVRNAALTITGKDAVPTILETSQTTYDPTYSSLALWLHKNGDSETRLISRGIVCYDPSGLQVCALVRTPTDPTAGGLTIYGGGTIKVWARGDDGGTIMATGGYRITASTFVINSSGVFVGAGVNCPSNEIVGQLFKVGSITAINSAGTFVGAGVNVGGNNIAGFNITATGTVSAQQVTASNYGKFDGGLRVGGNIGVTNNAISVRSYDGGIWNLEFTGGILTSATKT